ncbi:MAG: PAS domain-containing protein [Alphaproteobacteria bacterium]
MNNPVKNTRCIRSTSPPSYWQGKRAGRAMPSRCDLDPCEIPKLLPNLILFDVRWNPLDFRYRLVGTHLDYHMSEPRTGQWVSAIAHQSRGSVFWNALETVALSREPMSSSIPYVGPHRDYKRAEDIIMPLSDDDATVNMLFVAVAFLKKEDERP